MEVRLEIISWTERFKTIFSLSRGVVYLFCNQGHPMTVFCTISVGISKLVTRILSYLRTAKISRRPLHSCTIFEAQLINSLRLSEVHFFTFHSPG